MQVESGRDGGLVLCSTLNALKENTLGGEGLDNYILGCDEEES